MRLVPVFILETHNPDEHTECLPKFVRTDNARPQYKNFNEKYKPVCKELSVHFILDLYESYSSILIVTNLKCIEIQYD